MITKTQGSNLQSAINDLVEAEKKLLIAVQVQDRAYSAVLNTLWKLEHEPDAKATVVQ